MKQTKQFLRPLLMAIVMMVGMLVPKGAWAQSSPVTVGDEGFSTIQEAINHIVDDGLYDATLTLHQDFTLEDYDGIDISFNYDSEDFNFTIDLNGHTITGGCEWDNNYIGFSNNGSGLSTVTIANSCQDKKGKLFNCNLGLNQKTKVIVREGVSIYPSFELLNLAIYVVSINSETASVENYGDIYGVTNVHGGSFINKGRMAYVNGEFENYGSYCAYFNWADDGSSFRALVYDGNILDYNEGDKNTSITSVVTKAPTCTEPGLRTVTGTVFYGGQEYTDTKEVEIPAGHSWNASNDYVHECNICKLEAEHDWSNGKCTACNYECTHTIGMYDQWENGVCTICGMECKHDWESDEDGHACNICDLGDAEHDWSNKDGKCAACGYECRTHDWFDGECEICGILCHHELRAVDDGEDVYHLCSICNYEGSHNFIKEDGKCTECGYVCEHTQKSLNAEPDEHGLYHYICDICDTEDENGVILSGEGESATTIELTADSEGNFSAQSVGVADGKTFSTPVEFTVPSDQVTVERTFTVNKPATVMLPFSIGATLVKGAKFYEFKGVKYENNEWVADMSPVANVEAYKPYLVILDADNETGKVTFGNTSADVATFAVTPEASAMQTADENGWTFKAVNANKTWAEDDPELGKAYGFAGHNATYDDYSVAQGEFIKVGAGATAAPGRCYLVKEGALAANAKGMRHAAEVLPSSIKVRFINGEATGIATLNTETGEFTLEGWYDLNGRKINAPAKGGIYVKDGKKVLVK